MADALRVNAASLQNSAADVLWADGCHPLLLHAGRSLDGARLVGPAVEYWRGLASPCDPHLSPGPPGAPARAAQLAAADPAAGQAPGGVAVDPPGLAPGGRALAAAGP